MENPVQNVMNRFKNHSNVKMIMIYKTDPNKRFSVCRVSYNKILKQIKDLNTIKNTAKQYPNKTVKIKLFFFFNFFSISTSPMHKELQRFTIHSIA